MPIINLLKLWKKSKQEYETALVTGKGGSNLLFKMLLQLEVGKDINIAKKIGEKHGRVYRGGCNGKTGGWLLQRVN